MKEFFNLPYPSFQSLFLISWKNQVPDFVYLESTYLLCQYKKKVHKKHTIEALEGHTNPLNLHIQYTFLPCLLLKICLKKGNSKWTSQILKLKKR